MNFSFLSQRTLQPSDAGKTLCIDYRAIPWNDSKIEVKNIR